MTALTRRELLRNSVLSGAGLFIAFHIPSKVRAAPAAAKQPPNPDYIPGTMLLTTIGDAVDGLTPRQRRILQLRFGLIDGHARTRDKVGKLFGITAERVGEIELQALRKLPLLPTAGPGTRPDPR